MAAADPPRAVGADRRRAAVLGSPIGHSLSPRLHQAAYRALGIDWSYQAVACGVAELPGTLDRLAADHAGVSLTMPLKRAVLDLLDDADETVQRVQAANTVLFAADGRRTGANTDVAGASAALTELRERAVEWSDAVLLLGAGGTARAVLAALRQHAVPSVRVVARDTGRAAELAGVGEGLGVAVEVHDWASAAELAAASRLVVSTVPPGATEGLGSQLAEGRWPAGTALFDVVYAPWPTPLARAAAAAGAPLMGGLSMLVEQAAEQVRLMTGRRPPVDALRAAVDQAG